MSLEICEVKNLDYLKIKYSKIFIDKVLLIIKPEAQLSFKKINEELYKGKEKVYFPVFENIIFLKNPKYLQEIKKQIAFKGNFLKEDEVNIIKSEIKKFVEKERQNYQEYLKAFDKSISELINNMNTEIINQKNFQKSEYLTRKQYNENIILLANCYQDILKIKIDNDINLKNDDKIKINIFYKNMIEGLKNNNLDKEILIDV